MNIFNFISDNKKKLEKVCLVIVILTLIFILLGLVKDKNLETKPTVCFQCRHFELRKINVSKIDGYKCSKCGSTIGLGWKCRDCDYEFAVKLRDPPPNIAKNDYPEYYLNLCRCPNCGSINTDPMLINPIRKRRK